MIADVLTHTHLSVFACVSLVIFLTIYVLAMIWIFRKGSKIHYEKLAQRALTNGYDERSLL